MGNIQNAINSSLGTGAFLANQSGMLDTVKENRDIKRQNETFQKNNKLIGKKIDELGTTIHNPDTLTGYIQRADTLGILHGAYKDNREAQNNLLQRASMKNSKYTQMMLDNFVSESMHDASLNGKVEGLQTALDMKAKKVQDALDRKHEALKKMHEPQRPSDYNAGIEEQTNKMVAGMNPTKTMSPNDIAMYKAAQDLSWEREKRANSDALFNFIKQQAKGGIE